MLETMLQEGGAILPLILITALLGHVLACERLLVWLHWRIRERAFYRPDLGRETLRALLNHSGAGTPLAALLAQGAALPAHDQARWEQAMQAQLLARLPQVDARISTIGWLGNILPMLGLLGTVSGMIHTFADLALTTSRQVLSQGLSEALWTTEVGLLGALPLLAIHHLLSRFRSRWLHQLELGLTLLREEVTLEGRDKESGEGVRREP